MRLHRDRPHALRHTSTSLDTYDSIVANPVACGVVVDALLGDRLHDVRHEGGEIEGEAQQEIHEVRL